MLDLVIVGLGNDCRGDDAAGLLAARELRRRSRGRFRVAEHEGDGAALIELWQPDSAVILIDAVQSGSRPGTIHRFDATERKLAFEGVCGSTHALGAESAIELARTLQRLPTLLIVYGIEGREFAPGRRVSRAVQRAIPEVVRRVWSEAPLIAATEFGEPRAARWRADGRE